MTTKTPKGTKPRGKPALRIVSASQGEVVHLAKGQGRNAHGLTGKQEAFCQGVGTRGETLAVAYRAAYDAANMAPHTVHNEACKLMARPDIAARVNALVQEKQAKTQHDANRTRQYVIERLHTEASDPNNPPSVRVRALELLGKLGDVGAFVERTSAEAAPSSQAELAATLEARLRAVLAKAG
jgi:hypothetical protein